MSARRESILPPPGQRLNRLQFQASPYLLQHAGNPIDWYPWSEEAFRKASSEDKPIFLSIGYSTCHWCHVMAHESFEDADVAAFLNDHFISIKVDREERPDIDQVYMDACQAMTGSGGWPLTIFMTPDGAPFFAGTYFPRLGRHGLPGFLDLARLLAHLWSSDRRRLLEAAHELVAVLTRSSSCGGADLPGPEIGKRAAEEWRRAYDAVHGGFGRAPKFPMGHLIMYLLNRGVATHEPTLVEMAATSLRKMIRGGLFDQIGFGFCRYSVDDRWLVPHFEKMLYDNALLAMACTDAWQISGDPLFAVTARRIFEYAERELLAPEGCFYSAENADSEGQEGRFYLFTYDEAATAVGDDLFPLAQRYFGLTRTGNFEGGHSVLSVALTAEELAVELQRPLSAIELDLESIRQRLFAARQARLAPSLDDKILTSWNGLMIAALARASFVLAEPEFLARAEKAAEWLWRTMRLRPGRLLHSWRAGISGPDGFAEDYAFFVWGLIELYEASGEDVHLQRACELHRELFDQFWDQDAGGLFMTSTQAEPLFRRPKDGTDGALPSANSVAAYNGLRLARLVEDTPFEDQSRQIIQAFADDLERSPTAFPHLLQALDGLTANWLDITIHADTSQQAAPFLDILRAHFLPYRTIAWRPLSGQASSSTSFHSHVTICPSGRCLAPFETPASLVAFLKTWRPSPPLP
jgi:uncharacterized protein YyaL (SSP411 family)